MTADFPDKKVGALVCHIRQRLRDIESQSLQRHCWQLASILASAKFAPS